MKKLSKNAIMSIIERAAKIKLELYNKTLIIKNNSESETNNIETTTDNYGSSPITDFKSSKEILETNKNVYVDKEVLELVAIMSDGDARNSLNVNLIFFFFFL